MMLEPCQRIEIFGPLGKSCAPVLFFRSSSFEEDIKPCPTINMAELSSSPCREIHHVNLIYAKNTYNYCIYYIIYYMYIYIYTLYLYIIHVKTDKYLYVIYFYYQRNITYHIVCIVPRPPCLKTASRLRRLRLRML